MNLLNITCFGGLLLLNFFCFLDFKQNIIRPKSRLPFYSALVLFLFANTVIYIALLSFSVGIDFGFKPNVLFYYGKAMESPDISFQYRHVAPIIVSVLYFGTGKARFQIFGKEFSLYDNMIHLFRRMFPLSLGASKQLSNYLNQLGEETEKLNKVIENLHDLATERSWKIPNEEWNGIESDQKLIENDINFLREIDCSISENLHELDIHKTKEKIGDEIKNLRIGINTRLKKYIRNVIATNIRDEMALHDIAQILDIAEPDQLLHKRPPSFFARSLGLSFLCGTSLGTVLQLAQTPHGPYERILFLCVGFFIFLSIFTFIKNRKKTVEGFSGTLALGAIAGFLGHLAFEYSYRIVHFKINLLNIETLVEIAQRCILGMALGTFSALIAFCFRYYLGDRIHKTTNKFLSMGIAGGFVFWFLLLAFGEMTCSILSCPQIHIAYFLTGFIVLLGIAFVSGALEHHDEKVQDTVIESAPNFEAPCI